MTRSHETATRPWPVTLIFMLCFVMAQADKQVMGLLAVPVQEAFSLSNAELGLLQGAAFALAYALGGLPIAALIDRGNRVRIAAICVAVWSVATILCGAVGSFIGLFLFRSITAVAEAGVPPAFFSISAQQKDRRKVAQATTLFMLAPFVGGGLVLFLGGLLLRMVTGANWQLPFFDAPWRLVFLAVGAPGLVLVLVLVMAVQEPARPPVPTVAHPHPDIREVLSSIFVKSRFLRFYYLGLLFFTVIVYAGSAWFPATLVRVHGLTPAAAGTSAGMTYLAAGVAGTLCVNWLVTARRDITTRFLVRQHIVVSLLLLPIMAGLALVPSATGSVVLYGLYAFLSAGVLASMAVPIQLNLEHGMLGRGMAAFAFLTSAIGGTLGPLVVGLLSDRLRLGLDLSLAATCVTSAALAVLLLRRAERAIA